MRVTLATARVCQKSMCGSPAELRQAKLCAAIHRLYIRASISSVMEGHADASMQLGYQKHTQGRMIIGNSNVNHILLNYVLCVAQQPTYLARRLSHTIT
jgi:hypothetical protein